MIFQLTHSTYDASIHFYFEAPEGATEADFKALCDHLMRESAHDAVCGKHLMRTYGAGTVSWIGYEWLCFAIAARLPEHGYKQVRFPTVVYSHGLIIDEPHEDCENVLGDVLPEVLEHNRKVREQLGDRREGLRGKREL
jgi:hypothetical protein